MTPDPEAMAASAEEAARLLRSIGHGGRLLILCHLSRGERSVGELQTALGLGQSALSQHLARLREDGLVAVRAEGNHRLYSLASEPAARVLELLDEFFCAPDRRA